MVQELMVHAICPECESPEVIRDRDNGELVCGECGLVIQEEMLDRGPDWQAFTPEERANKGRAGAPTSYSRFDKGLSTDIQVNRDAFGRPLPPKTKRQMWRLRRWQIRTRMHASKDRNLLQAMTELERLSEKLHIPSFIQETAAVIYRKALNADLIRGRCIANIVAAALYIACRLAKTPKTLNEIAKASPRDRKEISRCYRLLVRRLKVKMLIDEPEKYVSKIAENAGVSGEAQGLAIQILQEAKRRHMALGKDPSGLAAGALYIACKLREERVSQGSLARAAKVTEVTVRKRKKELKKKLNIESIKR